MLLDTFSDSSECRRLQIHYVLGIKWYKWR